MDNKKAYELMEEYNKWRRGAEIEMPEPKQIGEALDIIINEYKNVNTNKRKSNEKK